MLGRSSDPGARHKNLRLTDIVARKLFHERLESPLKQEPEDDDDDDDCYLDDLNSPEPENPPRVRSHSKSLRAMANPSAVWAHFDLCVNDPLRAQCRICGSVVVRGGANPRQCGTTNLHRHLRVHHGGRLIGKRYHVMQTSPQSTSAAKTIRIAAQPMSKAQLKPAPPPTANSSSKTLVLKTIPLKMKPVASGTIKMTSRQQSQQPPPPLPPPSKPPSNPMPQQSPEVCLRWNSYHSNMQNSFPSLLDSEEFVDVTLACEGRSLKCHKMILSSCSDYLATLLRENPCQHPIILMKDLKFWEVEALVKFMYRGEVNVAHDKLPQLLNAAEALQVKGLAGPTPSSQGSKPPMLIPQSKPASKSQALPNFRITKDVKNSSAAQPTVSPKRVPKRSLPESGEAPRTFTKIRLQRPRTPTSPSAPIKLEPLDIPLSPNDIFPGNDDSATNYENLMMHEDDPGGPDTPDEPNFPTMTTVQDLNDTDDNMEFVPSDFLEQEQDIADDECSRSSVEEVSTGGGGRIDEFENEKPARNLDNSSKKDKT